MDTQTIAESLGAKRSGKGWIAKCPAHEDRSPSLSITEGRDGRVLIKCHAGCPTVDIVGTVGLGLRDLFPESDLTPKQKQQYRKQKTRAEIEAALSHELLVLIQIVGQRVADRKLARDNKFREQRPDWRPTPNEHWEREQLAAKRVVKFIGELYGS